ncbi:aminotransferase [Brochothrix thermosphacta]|uniref:aminotransferase n=1 Tax=Brochothrix thermosphacta TaxID=2756 RepID=UPI000D7A82D7|nr:aminotransferase [Brochothrix thermosphacta]SPN74365.1 putative aminotransferase, ArcT [Brochothrix thermosphacta]
MKLEPFGVEDWMNIYETQCEVNIAESCVEALTTEELLGFSEDKQAAISDILKMKLTYGDIFGSEALREEIAKLYTSITPEQITIEHGGIGANHLVLETLIEPGDHIVSVLPNYQQHYSLPKSYGAVVDFLPLIPENNYLPDFDALEALLTHDTKLIAINNPNNPTGALMDEEQLLQLVELARKYDAYILSDEVYRGLTLTGENFTPSISDLYEKGISTSSMSKTFSLPGLRIGWIISPVEMIPELNNHRDYSTISCGMIDDYLATLALKHKDKILNRNLTIVRKNSQYLADWVAKEPHITYIQPQSGPIALLHYDMSIKSTELCRRLQNETGVFLVPGSVMGCEGGLRIGYANDLSVLKEGLSRFSRFLKTFD